VALHGRPIRSVYTGEPNLHASYATYHLYFDANHSNTGGRRRLLVQPRAG